MECPDCKGEGKVIRGYFEGVIPIVKTCPMCKGTGEVYEESEE